MTAALSVRPGKTVASAKQGFHPLRWVQRFFSRPLKLKRIGLQWHVVFAESRVEAPMSRPSSRGEALRQSHVALQELLMRHDDAKHSLPHLSHLEHALSRVGSRALKTLPLKVLQRAMDQLDVVEGDRPSEALMALRLRIDEAVRQRTPVNLKGDIANLEVTDASASLYDEVEDHFTNRMALDEIYASASGAPLNTK